MVEEVIDLEDTIINNNTLLDDTLSKRRKGFAQKAFNQLHRIYPHHYKQVTPLTSK